MKSRSFFYSFLIFVTIFFTNCGNKLRQESKQEILINADFSKEKINDKVLYSSSFNLEEHSGVDLEKRILKNFKVNRTQNDILFGFRGEFPDGWFFTKIINSTKIPKKIVINETNHGRCDAMSVFEIKNNKINNLGSISRTTPISKRQFSNFDYAIAIKINALDTMNVLIHTQRFSMIHEISFEVSGYEKYLENSLLSFFRDILSLIIIVLCALTLLIVGSIFSNNTMFALSLYCFTVLVTFACYYGFFDTIPYFHGIGLKPYNMMSFTIFIVNATYHFFGKEIYTPIFKEAIYFKLISNILIISNFAVAVLYSLPTVIFEKVEFAIAYLLSLLAFLNLSWVFYSAFFAYKRAKINYLLIVVVVSFCPLVIDQLIKISINSNYGTIWSTAYTYTFSTIVTICVLTIYRFREELVSKKNAAVKMQQLNESLENIRKGEIENIGRNLHDQVGNTLASALGYLNLKTINRDLVQNLVLNAINDIRFLSHNLVKDDNQPITEKIDSLVSRFNDFSSISFNFNDFTESKINQLEQQKTQNLYAIIQEILSNVLKHSKATESNIQVFMNESFFEIIIEDDGIGIYNNNEIDGIGLGNMKKRAELSKFKLVIESNTSGTNIIIEIPNED